ncbi:cysteine protease putative [Entamoeba histolytica]|uniref:Cysteine protease, putative n=4 Tax=Entamoeba histolytica TaxID=5759 RepID=B1N5A5_ENTH1|nr:cysteine protease, putative [Entamoeba histolytica HM-1:IMSS]XP_001914449.1 cysteine protease, putative [Entamoeba histolytica HM-1:IMSS]AAO03568.1 cysteine protease 11 [Entamoeba histolytica]EDS88775.1 cysteine protease, putative [Entamoeba histolytica HM-1:IMSS]EDS88853.1 cysteine protease, putative [Entamoeba histolytica HM-1:IMSS]GAT99366.1 cysteine protease putative [Entamoeba histolytica]GAT99514.1 cysteine protease putative [Entamoeba histolytica]|eukprot:XP_001914371.1 cysteine protease, putative [Entamoeba histolytica HM-1:IMSS]
MIGVVLVLLVLGSEGNSFNLNEDPLKLFEQFKQEYKKEYLTVAEELRRKAIFIQNVEMMREHNAKGSSYRMGINKFADMESNELLATSSIIQSNRRMGAKRIQEMIRMEKVYSTKQTLKQAVPDNYTLCTSEAEYNYCGTNNIDQNLCGGCYAIATAHHLSTIYAYLTKQVDNNKPKRKMLSAQQLLDCNTESWGGCGGGFAEDVLDSVDGIYYADDYPFIDADKDCENVTDCAKYRHECKSLEIDYPLKFATSNKFTHFANKNWEEIKEIIYKYHGFISAMKVTDSLLRYVGGIYKSESCTGKITDHIVVVDGYGECDGHKFLWVRSSWGNDWGVENGHFKIDWNTLCGINGVDEYDDGSQLQNNLYVEMELGTGDTAEYNPKDGAGDDNKDPIGCVIVSPSGDPSNSPEDNKTTGVVMALFVFLMIFFI